MKIYVRLQTTCTFLKTRAFATVQPNGTDCLKLQEKQFKNTQTNANNALKHM